MQTSAMQLDDHAAQALADLLPLLACGEEAAAIAFGRLGRNTRFECETQSALHLIEAEEQVHDDLLRAMATTLPEPKDAAHIRRAARHFHLQLSSKCPIEHLARIAAIDAGVCTILARLTAIRRPLRSDRHISATLRWIQRDESKHVAVSRNIVFRHAQQAASRDSAAQAREALAKLVLLGGASFDALHVDPDSLVRDLARLPNGLL